jgi:DNA-binding beta-propeller fold protein YncE
VQVAVAVALVAGAVTGIRLAGHHASPPRPAKPAAAVTSLHRHLLGVTAGWELLGWGPRGVVRIQLARGRITVIPVPPLSSTGGVSFVVTPRLAIIRPIDFVPGYEVPDAGPARQLPGLLDQGGPAVPGPDPAQLWVVTEGIHQAYLTLVGLDGKAVGAVIQLPEAGPPAVTAAPDGRGSVLLSGSRGVYDAGPSGLRRVARSIAAVGLTRWLAVTCRHRTHCRDEVIDTADGSSERLPGPAPQVQVWPPGVISPDGSQAAVLAAGGGEDTQLSVINLGTGITRNVSVTLDQRSLGGQMLAWSPDGKWLFVVAAHGKLQAIRVATGQVTGLGAALPPLQQIAVRSAPR